MLSSLLHSSSLKLFTTCVKSSATFYLNVIYLSTYFQFLWFSDYSVENRHTAKDSFRQSMETTEALRGSWLSLDERLKRRKAMQKIHPKARTTALGGNQHLWQAMEAKEAENRFEEWNLAIWIDTKQN